MNRLKHMIGKQYLKTLYDSLIHSYLSYKIILWGGTYSTHLNGICVCQKKAVRCMYNSTYNAHTHPLFQDSKLLKSDDFYRFEVCKFVHNVLHKKVLRPLCDVFNVNAGVHDHGTRQRNNPHVHQIRTVVAKHSLTPRGGGGHSWYILVGVCRSTSKKGGLRHGHNPKKGGLRHGYNPKKGGLRHGHESKKGVLGTGTSRKRGVLRTGLVKKTILVTDVAQRGVLGAYLLITLTFSCQHDQLVGVYSDRLKNRGLRHGSGQKRGVLGTGQARKKGGLRHGSGQKRGVFTAAHTCTGHICECPPPPPPPGLNTPGTKAMGWRTTWDQISGQEGFVQAAIENLLSRKVVSCSILCIQLVNNVIMSDVWWSLVQLNVIFVF